MKAPHQPEFKRNDQCKIRVLWRSGCDPRLDGQAPIDSYATEILLTRGTLDSGIARIEAEVVTLDATLHKGWLTPGRNGVCITAEVLVISD